MLYAGLKKEDFWRLMPQARRENEEKLKIYVLVSCAMFSVLLAVSLFARIFPVNTILSFAVMALVSAAIQSSRCGRPVRVQEKLGVAADQ